VVLAVVTGAAVVGSAGPAAATSCRFGDGVVRARVDGGTALQMFAWPAGTAEAGQIWWGDQSDSSQQGFCGRATVRNTDRVVVTGTGRTGRLDYQLPHRPFGPGRSAEAAGVPEIEFVLRGGMTRFRMTGLGGVDGEAETVRLGRRGVDTNGDGDVDVRFRSRVLRVALELLGGDDLADAGGGHGTGAAWFRRRSVVVSGGVGDDVLRGHAGVDALLGDVGVDVLRGRSGDDVLAADDGAADAAVDGGPGHDSAWFDDVDEPVGIEERLVR
jgi:hypothetical protein